jgi:hypothetical protein
VGVSDRSFLNTEEETVCVRLDLLNAWFEINYMAK